MVDGTGLENQHTKVSQVRILSLPPKKDPVGPFLIGLFSIRIGINHIVQIINRR